jgi:mono/diheme cytochrome c family protein
LKTIAFSGFVFSVVTIFGACGGSPATNSSSNSAVANTAPTNLPAKTPPLMVSQDTSRGRELYVAQCANCHKETGEGGPVVVDGRKIKADNLTDDRRKKLTDEKMIKIMVDGIEDEGMPSYKDKLSEAEMREIVRYIRVDLQKMPADQPYANSASPQR